MVALVTDDALAARKPINNLRHHDLDFAHGLNFIDTPTRLNSDVVTTPDL